MYNIFYYFLSNWSRINSFTIIRIHTQPSPQMSSINGTFFSLVFPRLLFCLLVVRIISTVMSHTFVDVFPSHPSSLFLSPTPSHTHTHTQKWAKLVFMLTLSYTHAHKSIQNHILRRSFVPQSTFLFHYFISNPTLFVLCSVLPLFVLCFGETKTAFLYYICKQTTTPSVLTIGSLPVHLPSPTILLSRTTISHSYTYILARSYTHKHSH